MVWWSCSGSYPKFKPRLPSLPPKLHMLTLNNGRPISETRAQISRLPQFYRYFAALALTRRSDVIPIEGPYLCYTQRVPLGVVALMTSFNHPLMILSKSLAPALATGNSVVIKASEQTPLTALATHRIARDVLARHGFEDVFQLVIGPVAEVGEPMLHDRRLPLISATGSCAMGRHVAEQVGKRLGRKICFCFRCSKRSSRRRATGYRRNLREYA